MIFRTIWKYCRKFQSPE